jgi:Spy/CpxP family protein refolding chaperone
LNNSQTAQELSLTESQRQKTDAILEKLQNKLNQARNARGPEGWKKDEEARAASGEEMLSILTPEQQGRWNEMIGEPFKGEIGFGPPGDRPLGPPPGGGPSTGGKDRDPGAAPKSG